MVAVGSEPSFVPPRRTTRLDSGALLPMKRLLCLATLALTAFGCADSEPVPGDVVVFDESTTADHRWKGLGTCSALGASINFGIGASPFQR